MKRLAAIDVGTNSVRLIVAETTRGGFTVLDEEKAQVRLGEGLGATGELSEDAQARTIEALARMTAIAKGRGSDTIRAVATHAVRAASNGREFAARVERELSLPLEIISAEDEGRLAFLAAAAHIDLAGRTAIVDIGGGSVEVVRATDGQIERVTSLPLGVVTLSEMTPAGEDPPSRGSLLRVRDHVRRTLTSEFGSRPDPVTLVAGSGGTVTSLAAMVAAQLGEDYASVQGRAIAAADIVHTLAHVRELPLEARRRIPGLPPYRADIIVAGILLLREIMRLLGANRLIVNEKGLREGLVLDAIARGGRAAPVADEREGLWAFARRCRADQRHARHVATLALSLFDQLADGSLGPGHRRLLEAAAILHDVGYFIAYRRHHRHSCHLISHAELPGFSPREVAVIAAIARYHRGAMPKPRHDEYARLSPEDRETVLKLGGLLRLADGLDRGRAQRVESVTLTREADTVRIVLAAAEEPNVELYGAVQKGDLFRRAFGLGLDVAST